MKKGLIVALISGLAGFGQAKPNVLLIVADDFGYGCINANGAPKAMVRTPNLDHLAESGMRFTRADTPASICSPTRYALLTGRYAWRGPLPYGVVNVFDPLVVEPDRLTMPMFFKKLGYQTAQIGKWHLGYTNQKPPVDFTKRLTPGPNDLGFDYHFGLPQNLDDMLRVWIENDHIYGLRSSKTSAYCKSFYGGQYVGFDAPQRQREEALDFLTDKAVDWIQKACRSDSKEPFFLYFATPATHHPVVPSDLMRGSSGCGAYGDFVQDLDYAVGRLLNTLEYEGVADDTLVIFTADNGTDIPKEATRPEIQAIQAGLTPNGINRGDKHTIWEGGCRVPLLIRWNGNIQPGAVCDRMVNIVDIFATLADIVSGKPVALPDSEDSSSFAPTLFGKDQPKRKPMVTSNVAGLHALHDGQWKYIDPEYPDATPEGMRKSTKKEAEPALYKLEDDPSETTNLIDKYPEIVKKMRDVLYKYRHGQGAP